jgi:hypothetical protein
MSYGSSNLGRYQNLRRTGRVLSRLAPVVTFGIWSLGLSLFLDQSRDLISDAQFTWGERRVMAVVAVVTVGGYMLVGWVVGRLFKAAADLIDVLADLGDSSWRTGDMIEQHVIPLLGRIATSLEQNLPARNVAPQARTIRPEPTQNPRRPDPDQSSIGR